MSPPTPSSVLFCCDLNAIRSPMAEGLLKQHSGKTIFVQSVGVRGGAEIDGFAIAVCREIGIELERHKTRSFDDFEEWGDDLGSYDLVVALSPASLRRALEYTRYLSFEVEYWPTMDPVGLGENRDSKLESYRQVRDQIKARIVERFPPDA